MMRWKCPVCAESLQLIERSWRCANKHSYDRAREGYVNLLLANQKNSADPGDNREMLLSRRHFLEQGFYAPLAAAIGQHIAAAFPVEPDKEQPPLTLLDIGCGEGYYLSQFATALGEGEGTQFAGTDISREATRLAAKKYPTMQFAVASSYSLPVADASQSVVTRVFAPASDAEVARVLQPGGLYLWAYPGAQHLYELREMIYEQPRQHEEPVLELGALGFAEAQIVPVSYPLHLPDSAAVAALLAMTPYFWAASQDVQARCQQLETMDLTVDFRLAVLRKLS